MDSGVYALLLGLIVLAVIWATPMGWLKTAGGLLLLLMVGTIAIDVVRLLAR